MKKLIIASLALLACWTAPVVAAEDIQVNDLVVRRKENNTMEVSFKAIVDKKATRSDYTLTATPVLYNGLDAERLTAIVVEGTRAIISNQRREMSGTVEYPNDAIVVPNGKTIDYVATVPYSPWMDKASVRLEKTSKGCCTIQNLGSAELSARIDTSARVTSPELDVTTEPTPPQEIEPAPAPPVSASPKFEKAPLYTPIGQTNPLGPNGEYYPPRVMDALTVPASSLLIDPESANTPDDAQRYVLMPDDPTVPKSEPRYTLTPVFTPGATEAQPSYVITPVGPQTPPDAPRYVLSKATAATPASMPRFTVVDPDEAVYNAAPSAQISPVTSATPAGAPRYTLAPVDASTPADVPRYTLAPVYTKGVSEEEPAYALTPVTTATPPDAPQFVLKQADALTPKNVKQFTYSTAPKGLGRIFGYAPGEAAMPAATAAPSDLGKGILGAGRVVPSSSYLVSPEDSKTPAGASRYTLEPAGPDADPNEPLFTLTPVYAPGAEKSAPSYIITPVDASTPADAPKYRMKPVDASTPADALRYTVIDPDKAVYSAAPSGLAAPVDGNTPAGAKRYTLEPVGPNTSPGELQYTLAPVHTKGVSADDPAYALIPVDGSTPASAPRFTLKPVDANTPPDARQYTYTPAPTRLGTIHGYAQGFAAEPASVVDSGFRTMTLPSRGGLVPQGDIMVSPTDLNTPPGAQKYTLEPAGPDTPPGVQKYTLTPVYAPGSTSGEPSYVLTPENASTPPDAPRFTLKPVDASTPRDAKTFTIISPEYAQYASAPEGVARPVDANTPKGANQYTLEPAGPNTPPNEPKYTLMPTYAPGSTTPSYALVPVTAATPKDAPVFTLKPVDAYTPANAFRVTVDKGPVYAYTPASAAQKFGPAYTRGINGAPTYSPRALTATGPGVYPIEGPGLTAYPPQQTAYSPQGAAYPPQGAAGQPYYTQSPYAHAQTFSGRTDVVPTLPYGYSPATTPSVGGSGYTGPASIYSTATPTYALAPVNSGISGWMPYIVPKYAPMTSSGSLAEALAERFPFLEYSYGAVDGNMPGKEAKRNALVVYFRQNQRVIEHPFRNNDRTLAEFIASIRAIENSGNSRVSGVVIAGFASPEGTYNYNDQLSRDRAAALKSFVINNTGISPNAIHIYGGGEDWDGLRDQVAASSIGYRNEILRLIDNVPVWDNASSAIKEQKLKSIGGGEPYRYMYSRFFPDLRNATYLKVYYESLSPLDPTADAINRAQDLVKRGDYNGALHVLAQVSTDVRSYNTIGVCYMMLNNFEKAKEFFQAAMTNYGSTTAKANYDQIVAREAAMRGGR
ncbi:MAG: OmpA family protein [Rikenellaceae bacterium]|jgi:outer membrane protein OmpA-like peptidoglycan-associated protein|nr:OmpA family protein [Rikenellaceae bacterium]